MVEFDTPISSTNGIGNALAMLRSLGAAAGNQTIEPVPLALSLPLSKQLDGGLVQWPYRSRSNAAFNPTFAMGVRLLVSEFNFIGPYNAKRALGDNQLTDRDITDDKKLSV